mmetsp:Transcript_22530/g.72049  ORF Transcript_22530/g.72049 Transcript_22530/m.72049 type:complete len:279 (-) Transcript_22530:11-847(-)
MVYPPTSHISSANSARLPNAASRSYHGLGDRATRYLVSSLCVVKVLGTCSSSAIWSGSRPDASIELSSSYSAPSTSIFRKRGAPVSPASRSSDGQSRKAWPARRSVRFAPSTHTRWSRVRAAMLAGGATEFFTVQSNTSMLQGVRAKTASSKPHRLLHPNDMTVHGALARDRPHANFASSRAPKRSMSEQGGPIGPSMSNMRESVIRRPGSPAISRACDCAESRAMVRTASVKLWRLQIRRAAARAVADSWSASAHAHASCRSSTAARTAMPDIGSAM